MTATPTIFFGGNGNFQLCTLIQEVWDWVILAGVRARPSKSRTTLTAGTVVYITTTSRFNPAFRRFPRTSTL